MFPRRDSASAKGVPGEVFTQRACAAKQSVVRVFLDPSSLRGKKKAEKKKKGSNNHGRQARGFCSPFARRHNFSPSLAVAQFKSKNQIRQ